MWTILRPLFVKNSKDRQGRAGCGLQSDGETEGGIYFRCERVGFVAVWKLDACVVVGGDFKGL